MQKTEEMPLWVFLAFSSIDTRKGALTLIWAAVAFTLYCVPWSLLLPAQSSLAKLFLIEDWSWLTMMVPMLVWYWMSLKWVDKHSAWVSAEAAMPAE